MDENTCPICKGCAIAHRDFATGNWDFDCRVCGTGRISRDAGRDLRNDDRPLLSAHFRNNPDTLVTRQVLDRVLERSWPLKVPEQLDALLLAIAEKTSRLGDASGFDPKCDYPLLWAKDQTGAQFLCESLLDAGLLRGGKQEIERLQRDMRCRLELSAAGWQRVAELEHRQPRIAQVFVAMRFASETDSIYNDAVAPAVRETGYDPFRVDRSEHNGRIDDEIVAQIRRSNFMVADFTGQRPSVYFEAGMMLGLGREVIWMCDKEEKTSLHFDVSHYNFILYESETEARELLRNRILATRGEGPKIAEQGSR